MSQEKIKHLLEIWASSILQATQGESAGAPFNSPSHLFKVLDAIPLGEVPWRCFTISYDGPRPEGSVPSWMTQKFEVWFRCPRKTIHSILANPEFKNGFNTAPYREYTPDGKRKYTNLFSGNWAWRQAVSGLLLSHLLSLLKPSCRIPLLKMRIRTAPCLRPSCSAATRQPCLSLLGRPSSTPSTFPSAIFTAVFDVPTPTASH